MRLHRRLHKGRNERNSREPRNNHDLWNSLDSLVRSRNHNASSSRALSVPLVQRKLNVRSGQLNSSRVVNASQRHNVHRPNRSSVAL